MTDSSFTQKIVEGHATPPVGEMLSFLRQHRKLALLEMLCVCVTIVLSLTGNASVAKDVLVQVAFLHGVLWGVLGASGIVSDDIHSGTVAYYLQKTNSLRGFYFRQFAVRIAGLLVVTLMLGGAMLVLRLLGSLESAELRRYFSVSLLLSSLNATIVYAMSAAAVRRDAVSAVVYMLSTAAVAVRMAAQKGTGAAVLRLFLFPVDALLEVVGAGGRRESDLPGSVVLAFQFLLWLLLAYFITDRGIARSVQLSSTNTE